MVQLKLGIVKNFLEYERLLMPLLRAKGREIFVFKGDRAYRI